MQHLRHDALLLAAVSAAWAPLAARADAEADKAAIVERLQRWTMAFNARDRVGACDLFAPDLAYTLPEVPSGSRATLCANLDRVLSDPGLRLRYDEPIIHEIILSGDLAVVRLTWTLATEAAGGRRITLEDGIDIFRRQPDGRWSIARFMAFTTQAGEPSP